MIYIKITPLQLRRAKELANKLPFRRAFHKKFIGMLGEIIVLDSVKNAVKCNTYDYDILYCGQTYDIKTITTTKIPNTKTVVRLFKSSLHQKCKYLIFCAITPNYKHGWILGKIEKEKFLKLAVPIKRGTINKKTQKKYTKACFILSAKYLSNI